MGEPTYQSMFDGRRLTRAEVGWFSSSPYVLGPVHFNTKSCATFRTKPVDNHTGGGYEHWHSSETVPFGRGFRKKQCTVFVHRLLAVVACYPPEWTMAEINVDMIGKDIHHENGVRWLNYDSNIEAIDHGRHSSITQAEQRAYAEDGKRLRDGQETIGHQDDLCDQCGKESDTRATSEAWDGRYCLDCAMAHSDGSAIEI